MRADYAVAFHFHVAEQLFTIPRHGRAQLMAFFDSLERDPHQSGDYAETDADERQNQVKIVGRWAVTYWSDHPVKEVRVVRLEMADA
ncbi:MAG: hypothetical protein WCS01_02650 [bacterium]